MKLSDLLDTDALSDQIRDNYITAREHPDDPSLLIYNYTPKAQYEQHWTPETSACRGLIVHGEEVIAKPFTKFFNYGEPSASPVDLDAPAVVTDKADGSLGILYTAPDGRPAIATRGSFTSDQALHATERYRYLYEPHWSPVYKFTYMFEIVYPANRIVLDYGDTDDLILLYPVSDPTWPGPRVKKFPYRTLREALAAEPRPNAEGFVVHDLSTGTRVKIKQADYLALHKIVTGLNELTVWEHMGQNNGVCDELFVQLPEEFHKWTSETAINLLRAHDAVISQVLAAYGDIRKAIGQDYTRKEFALAAQSADPQIRSLLFLMEDRKPLFDAVWKKIRPVLKERLYEN